MKVLVFILAVCVASSYSTLTDDQITKLKAYKQACVAQSGVDEAAVDAHHQSMIKDEQVTRDSKLDCYYSCFLKMLGLQKDCGKIRADKMIENAKANNADMAKVTEVVNKCSALTGNDACDTAGKVVTCLVENKIFHELHA